MLTVPSACFFIDKDFTDRLASQRPVSVIITSLMGGFSVISISDMLALLDKIPIWKQLKELPQRVESLEKRIAELENKPISTGDVCPKCKNKTFELISTRKHPVFGDAGVHERFYKCSKCEFEETKTADT
jgi:hypothetical protein